MRTASPIWFLLLFSLITASARTVHAAHAVTTSAQGFRITVEPIVAYEYTQRDTPSPHRHGMLVYGARFTAGRPHLAAEGEYTLGNDTEVFTTPSAVTVNTKRENVRLGVRGTYELASMVSALARFGGQASKATVSQVDLSGVSSSAGKPDWEIHPYAGAGLQLTPARFFALGLEATYVFNSVKDFTKNTVQLAGSIRVLLSGK